MMRTHHTEMALAEQPTCTRRSRDIAELAADSAPSDSDDSVDNAMLREHATWALDKIGGPLAEAALAAAAD